jgi:uncharacterized membrane protein YjjP (DUF1212 family)
MQTISEIKEEKIDPAVSTMKQKLGDARRRIKQIDLREKVVSNPLPAIGIGLAAGALVGLIRPMPHRNRVSGALMGLVTGLAFRAARSYAMAHLATYAKDFIKNTGAPESGGDLEGSKAAYTPPF